MKIQLVVAPALRCMLVLLVLLGCKEEDVSQPRISLQIAASEVWEANPGTKIEFVLDKPASEDIIVNYSTGGTATYGEDYIFDIMTPIKIQKGYTKVVFDIIFNNDSEEEDAETAIITITGTSGSVTLSPEVAKAVRIKDNDPPSLKIKLSWDSGNGTPGDVDMDLILWKNGQTAPFLISAHEGTGFETVNLANTSLDDIYGLSYVYYNGTSDNVQFTVLFANKNGTLSTIDSNEKITKKGIGTTLKGTYTLANLNNSQTVYIEHFFRKNGSSYVIDDQIFIPGDKSKPTRELSFVKEPSK